MYTLILRFSNDETCSIYCSVADLRTVLRTLVPSDARVVIYCDGIKLTNQQLGTSYPQIVDTLFEKDLER